MNETVITTVVLALVLTVAAAGAVIVTVAVVRAVRHRHSSVEERGRRALTGLASDRYRRQQGWGAASLGIIAASSDFGSGAGCAGGTGGGCGGCGGGGCGGGGCGGGG